MKIKKELFLIATALVVTGCGGTESPSDDKKEDEHTHVFEDKWTFDDTYHWHAATCGHDVKGDNTEHVFDQTTVKNSTTLINEASCTEPARYRKTCICGVVSSKEEDVYEVGTPTGHTFSEDWTYDATHHWHAATCGHDVTDEKVTHVFGETYKVTADGNKHYQECECGYKKEENHVVSEWTITKEATINEAGEKTGYCDVCEQKVTEVISKIYSTAAEVNALIVKIGNLTSIKMLDGSLIEETKAAYNNLSDSDKALVNNYSVLENAFTEWESKYSMVYDPLLNGAPVIDGHSTSISEDSTYGTILKINVPTINETSQFDFNINSETYEKSSILHIYVKSPFEAKENTSQSAWIGDFDRGYLTTLAPNAWTEITGNGKDLSVSGANATQLVEKISLQRYLNEVSFDYSGEYSMACIIAEKQINEEGAVMIPMSKDSIELVNTWGGDSSTVSEFSDTEHGSGVELNITSISGAYEIKINGLEKKKAKIFDFLYCYVYAPANAKFYFSQNEWRNQVMTVDVAPDDATNGTVANNQAQYSAGWHKIMIPISYLPDASSFYFEIYTPAALGKWIITDFCGGYTSKYISNAATRTCGLSTLNSSSGQFDGVFTKGRDDTYGSYDEITITDLSKCSWAPTFKVSGEAIKSDSQFLRFYVYSPLDYPMTMSIYGNGWYESIYADGHIFNTCLMPKQWNEIIITTKCYNTTDKAYRTFDFSQMTFFFEDIRKGSNIVLDGLKVSSFELLDTYPSDASQQLTYDINENAMYVLGTSNKGNQQMMGFVLVYDNKVIVIDGGVKEEYSQLKNILTALGGHVDYQIFTHAHKDHFGTFIEMSKDKDITVDTLVYNFPSWENLATYTASADQSLLAEFKSAIEAYKGNTITCVKGTSIDVGELNIEFLNNRYEITGDVNESSMCFKVTTPDNSVLFLGDLSKNKAPLLLEDCKDDLTKLNANYLQLAHHGQNAGSKELYEAVNPSYAIWCTTVRNYNNWTVNGVNTGSLKSAETKEWLKDLEVTDICPFYKTVKIGL